MTTVYILSMSKPNILCAGPNQQFYVQVQTKYFMCTPEAEGEEQDFFIIRV